MQYLAQIKRYGSKVAAGAAFVAAGLAAALPAHAVGMVDDATAALNSAKADALSVGGVVVAVVAGLVVVAIVISMIRKV